MKSRDIRQRSCNDSAWKNDAPKVPIFGAQTCCVFSVEKGTKKKHWGRMHFLGKRPKVPKCPNVSIQRLLVGENCPFLYFVLIGSLMKVSMLDIELEYSTWPNLSNYPGIQIWTSLFCYIFMEILACYLRILTKKGEPILQSRPHKTGYFLHPLNIPRVNCSLVIPKQG